MPYVVSDLNWRENRRLNCARRCIPLKDITKTGHGWTGKRHGKDIDQPVHLNRNLCCHTDHVHVLVKESNDSAR